MIVYIALLVLLLASCASHRPVPVQFQTAPPAGTGLRIAVIGDQQRTSRYEIWRERKGAHAQVVTSMLAQKPDALVVLGDMVFDGADDDDWAFYDVLMKPVADAHIPVFPIYGNHEYLRSSRAVASHMQRRFPGLRTTWYAVTIDSVTFVMINTNFERISAAMRREQLRWYDSTLQAHAHDDATRCIVVCGHHPPYTNSMNVSDHEGVKADYLPQFLRHPKSRLWLSGHSHAYERFRIQDRDLIVAGGGGAPRHKLMADDEARHQHSSSPRSRRMVSPFHYILLRRTGDSLDIVMQQVYTKEKSRQ